jgi:hypothetical protein
MEESRTSGRREEDLELLNLVRETHDKVIEVVAVQGQQDHDIRALEEDVRGLNWRIWGAAGAIISFIVLGTTSWTSSVDAKLDQQDVKLTQFATALQSVTRLVDRIDGRQAATSEELDRVRDEDAARRIEIIEVLKDVQGSVPDSIKDHIEREHDK